MYHHRNARHDHHRNDNHRNARQECTTGIHACGDITTSIPVEERNIYFVPDYPIKGGTRQGTSYCFVERSNLVPSASSLAKEEPWFDRMCDRLTLCVLVRHAMTRTGHIGDTWGRDTTSATRGRACVRCWLGAWVKGGWACARGCWNGRRAQKHEDVMRKVHTKTTLL